MIILVTNHHFYPQELKVKNRKYIEADENTSYKAGK
jgi:hypothetical protein